MPIEGIDKLLSNLKSIENNIESHAEKAMKRGAMVIRDQARLLCPEATGELRQSISVTSKTEGNTVKGIVYTNKEYAAYVEFGTGPKGQEEHFGISPNVNVTYSQNAWKYKDAKGKWHFTKGHAAQPYMYPAAKDRGEAAIKRVADTFAEAIKKGLK